MKPRVSFVMTAYNAAHHIEESLKALAKVDWPNFEIVVADDGSSDKTPEIVSHFSGLDPRIRFKRLGRVGRARALNQAIAVASGDFIAINDADDISLPQRIATTIAPFEKEASLALVAGGYEVMRDGEHRRASPIGQVGRPEPQRITYRDLYRRNQIVHSAIIFPKARWATAGGYNEGLTSFIDYDFYFRLLAQGPGLLLGETVVLYRKNMDSEFKRQKVLSYLGNYRATLRNARRLCSVPLIDRVYDLKPYAMAASLAWRRNQWRS